MGDRFNTVAGWALFAGIIALGGAIVSSKYFETERPEKMGYAIEGVEAEGEGGEPATNEEARPPVVVSVRGGGGLNVTVRDEPVPGQEKPLPLQLAKA